MKDGGEQLHPQLNFKLPNVAEFEAEQSAAYDSEMRFRGATLNKKVNGNAQPKITLAPR